MCEVVAPDPDVLSPKFQAYEEMEPSESAEAAALKLTDCGAMPVLGVAVNDAVGAAFGAATVAVRVVVPVSGQRVVGYVLSVSKTAPEEVDPLLATARAQLDALLAELSSPEASTC